jgi:hypothetical protein
MLNNYANYGAKTPSGTSYVKNIQGETTTTVNRQPFLPVFIKAFSGIKLKGDYVKIFNNYYAPSLPPP